MTNGELDALVARGREALEGVTPGPWDANEKGEHPSPYVCGAADLLVQTADERIDALTALASIEARALAAEAAALERALAPREITFEWSEAKDGRNPSKWHCQGPGYFAYVLIPYANGNDPAAAVGTWNANPNHRGRMGFASREEAITYCEHTIRDQAARELSDAASSIQTWGQPAARTALDTALADARKAGKMEGLRYANALVETAQWARNRLEAIADESWRGDARDFKRSLIGVFADFDEALAKCGSVSALAARVEGGDAHQTCGFCMGSGYGGHPDSGAVCFNCNGSGVEGGAE